MEVFAEIIDIAEPGVALLVDLSGVERAEIQSKTLRTAADIFKSISQDVSRRIAIIAPKPEIFGMARCMNCCEHYVYSEHRRRLKNGLEFKSKGAKAKC